MTPKQSHELYGALHALVQVFTDGRNYDTCNPYSRPEVKRALHAMQAVNGARDYLDAANGNARHPAAPREYTEEEQAIIGHNIAHMLKLRKQTGQRGWQNTWGWKTDRGIFNTILRLSEDINNDELHPDLTKGL